MSRILVAIVIVASGCFLVACATHEGSTKTSSPAVAREPRRLPGMQPTGQVLLPMQWSLQPAGRQIALGDFPVNIAMHPTQPFAAVLNAGYGAHGIEIVDLARSQVVFSVTLPQCFYGLCFDPEGKQLFASGAEHEVVHVFKFADGYLSDHREVRIADVKTKGVPAGVSRSKDGRTLYVANAWGGTLSLVPLEQPTQLKHMALEKESYPYATLPTKDGKCLYVSLWGKAGVAVVNLETLSLEATWPTESHPTEMALSADESLLYIACADSNHVIVFDTKTSRAVESISSALYPKSPHGSTPNSLALSPDGKVLLIANADNNNIAVIDVAERGESRSLGFIPVGWYPTSVRFGVDGRIYVANGKGLTSKANRHGPNPLAEPPASVREYIAGLFRGTLSVIDAPSPADMARYTRQAYACSPLRDDNATVSQPREAGNPVPIRVGDPSPIKHCIYVIKENRTYDQVFGDVPEGNGDRGLCIFPESVTPNHHKLVKQFVLLDNFYVESEVSADGHEWSMAAYATDFVEKSWPLNYREGGKGKITYPSEGNLPVAFPSSGYIWDRCKQAGVSYRSYGEFITTSKTPGAPAKAKVDALEGHFDPLYRGWDLDYPDVKRADRFIEELRGFEQAGEMPRFIVLRLPNDHTQGTVRGKPTPTAMVADNDLALGRVVEAVSRSRFWKETAMFVVEDDAQNGSDHVDAHRTVALVISPWTKRHQVDSTMYSTASMLRTMELILGLEPMTQFDAAAAPMYASFSATADPTSFTHVPASASLAAVNPFDAWGGELSDSLDFSKEDAADDLLLNEVVWHSVRGPDSPMPPPVRASFVFPLRGDDDD
jgi:YVTN family beta-propeller protein